MAQQFSKVLAANRGEIAIRIFRACHDLGLHTVAMYSNEDTNSMFRIKADEAYLIGENQSPLGAYLDIPAIIDLAKRRGVTAIHPGYGFLSENADFARACEANGIKFIGPPSQVLAQMGDKLAAKATAIACNVPIIPGSTLPLKNADEAVEKALSYGFPIILKAALCEFARSGYKAATMEDICTRHGISKGMMYHYFSGKDELYIALVTKVVGDLYEYLMAHQEDCCQRAFEGIADFYKLRETYFQDKDDERKVFEEAVLSPPEALKDEVEEFVRNGGVYFPDEVLFGNALTKVYNTPRVLPADTQFPQVDEARIRKVVDAAGNGYLKPDQIHELLDAAGIARAKEGTADNEADCLALAREIGFPLVMKVVGPVHKSDVGGVVLNVRDEETVVREFRRMMQIKDTYAVMLAQQLHGTEVFIGAKREGGFGHIVMCGLGGIFIEVLKDVRAGLAPIAPQEATDMIRSLRSYKIIQGVRGQEPVNEERFADAVVRVSLLVKAAPEIFEMDLNPLLGNKEQVVAVDARIRIEK